MKFNDSYVNAIKAFKKPVQEEAENNDYLQKSVHPTVEIRNSIIYAH
jgi:hypothetical protein